MSKIKRLFGLCLKKDDFTGVNKNKCKVFALWGKYIAEEHSSEEEHSSDEECPQLVFKEVTAESIESTSKSKEDKKGKIESIESTLKPKEDKERKIESDNSTSKTKELEFVCDHLLDDTGYLTVRRVKNRVITWNDGEVDTKGKTLNALELEWDTDLKVYLSTNESEDDDQTWIRVLKIL